MLEVFKKLSETAKKLGFETTRLEITRFDKISFCATHKIGVIFIIEKGKDGKLIPGIFLRHSSQTESMSDKNLFRLREMLGHAWSLKWLFNSIMSYKNGGKK